MQKGLLPPLSSCYCLRNGTPSGACLVRSATAMRCRYICDLLLCNLLSTFTKECTTVNNSSTMRTRYQCAFNPANSKSLCYSRQGLTLLSEWWLIIWIFSFRFHPTYLSNRLVLNVALPAHGLGIGTIVVYCVWFTTPRLDCNTPQSDSAALRAAKYVNLYIRFYIYLFYIQPLLLRAYYIASSLVLVLANSSKQLV